MTKRLELMGQKEAPRSTIDGPRLVSIHPPSELTEAALRVARDMLSIAERDPVPPDHANQVHGLLLRAGRLTVHTPLGTDRDQEMACAVVLAGQFHNRWVSHLEFTETPLLRMDFLDSAESGAAYLRNDEHPPSSSLTINKSLVDGTDIAHESVHVPQWWYADPQDPAERNLPASQMPNLSAKARSHSQELARELPRFDQYSITGMRSALAYVLHPIELMAFLEEASVKRNTPDRLEVAAAFADAGLNEIAPLLARAGHKMNSVLPRGLLNCLASLFFSSGVATRFDAKAIASSTHGQEATPPTFGDSAEQIIWLTDRFNEAMKSPAWNDDDTCELRRRMDQCTDMLATGESSRLNAEDFIAVVAKTLYVAWDELNDWKAPGALDHPGGETPSPETFAAAKSDPWRLLEKVIGPAARAAVAEDRPFFPGSTGVLPTLLDHKAESGFFEDVADVRSEWPQVDTCKVVDTVTRLAAHLNGLSLADIPVKLRPVATIESFSSLDIPHRPGLTAGAGQTRGAHFVEDTNQLFIPKVTLDEKSLEKTLSKLAVNTAVQLSRDLAATASGALIPQGNFDTVKLFRQYFRESYVEFGMQAKADAFVEAHPDSMAALLRDVAGPSDDETALRLRHVAVRPALKAQAKEDLDRGQGSAADEAYRASEWQRWHHPVTAIERAVVGADWAHEADRQVALLSPEARNLMQTAARLQGHGFEEAVSAMSPQRAFDIDAPMAASAIVRELVDRRLVSGDPTQPQTLRWSSQAVRQTVAAGITPSSFAPLTLAAAPDSLPNIFSML